MTAAAEHLTVDPSSPWWPEHRSRYHFAGSFVAGRDVLDIACGSGFGGPILLDSGARSVVGVDASERAIESARLHDRPRLEFIRADATRLPMGAASVGAVTSFETLEHIEAHERFIAELRRVLAADGVLILSTPNALHTQPLDGRPRNPFHVREFTPDELRELLHKWFGDVRLLAQRPAERFRPCPYWERPSVLPKDARGRARTLEWKATSRLPRRMQDPVSRALHGRTFLPGEYDFVYDDQPAAGHVLVAICHP
jgi:SAM-dependent methyltransferase